MRGVRLAESNGAAVAVMEDTPHPQPGRGELLIRIYAAGITPTKLLWYPTSHSKSGGELNWAVPSHEFSGVVAAVGEEVGGFEVGREVFGMNDWFLDGAMAEYCIAAFDAVAPKPPRVSHVEAASVPIGALTAWQGLFDRGSFSPKSGCWCMAEPAPSGSSRSSLPAFMGRRWPQPHRTRTSILCRASAPAKSSTITRPNLEAASKRWM